MLIGTCKTCKRKFEYPDLAIREVFNEETHKPQDEICCTHCGSNSYIADTRDPFITEVIREYKLMRR